MDAPVARPRSDALGPKWAWAFLLLACLITVLAGIDYVQGGRPLRNAITAPTLILMALALGPWIRSRWVRAGLAFSAGVIGVAWIVMRLAE
jgi:hypothetical protein